MCGANSAIGLNEYERALWAEVKEPLRRPGLLTGLMRGFLGDEEVAVVIGTPPEGRAQPLAVLVTDTIGAELVMPTRTAPSDVGPVAAHVGEFPVNVWLGRQIRAGEPVALEVTPWIQEHLLLYARQLWWPRSRAQSPTTPPASRPRSSDLVAVHLASGTRGDNSAD